MVDIKSYPTLKEWDDAGIRIKPAVYKDLDLNHWEGRVHLFIRMCVFSRLEIDNRTPFHKWFKNLKFETKEEFLEMFPRSPEDGDLWSEYQETNALPPFLLVPAMTKYELLFPRKDFVEITPVGKFVSKYLKESPEMEFYITAYCTNFLKEVEFIYKTCVKNKGNYKSLNFDWVDILQKKYNMEQMASFHRQFYGSNLLSDIACPYTEYGMTQFLNDFIFVCLLKDFNVDVNSILKVDSLINNEIHNNMEADKDAFLFADHATKVSETRVWKTFNDLFGELWGDDVANQF